MYVRKYVRTYIHMYVHTSHTSHTLTYIIAINYVYTCLSAKDEPVCRAPKIGHVRVNMIQHHLPRKNDGSRQNMTNSVGPLRNGRWT